MKYAEKLCALFTVTAIACGIFGGCGDCDKEAEKVTVLKWSVCGLEETKDAQEVWDKFNEELQKYLPGTKVEFDYYSISDYAEKWKLIRTSQGSSDIVWSGWMIDFVGEARNGTYMPLDDLIDEYAPDLRKEIPKEMLQKQTVDGKIYSIPCMQQMVSYISALDISTDFYERNKDAIDPEEISEFFASRETMDKECWDKIEQLIKLAKKGSDDFCGISRINSFSEKGYEWVRNPYKIRENGDSYEIINYYRTPEYKLYYDTYADWYKKGYINTGKNEKLLDICGSGNYLVGQGYFPTRSDIEDAESQGAKAYIKIPFSNWHYILFGPAATSTAISSECKNPEKAIKLIELMNTEKGKELYNLLVYGIEGKHYKKVNDKQIIPFDYNYTNQPDRKTPYGQHRWSVGNSFNAYEIYKDDPNPILKNDFIEQVNDDAKPSKLMGFVLDTVPIKTELKQIDAVVEEYGDISSRGLEDDHDKLYEQFVQKLVLAGDDKVVAEIERQIREWKDQQGTQN